MIYLIIYLVLVFITFVYSIYRLNIKAKLMFENGYEGTRYYFLRILVSDPWWRITLKSLWLAPIFIPLWVYNKCRNRYYRNRPRPVCKHAFYTGIDLVIEDNKDIVSLEEYNQKHNTNFTPEQVYGKRFVKKTIAQEQKEAERQKEYEKQAEAEREKEYEKQAEAEKEKEYEKQAEVEREILDRIQRQSTSEEDFDGPPF